MYGPLNSFDADHPVWSFEGVGEGRIASDDDGAASDVPNLGSGGGEMLQDRLDQDFGDEGVGELVDVDAEGDGGVVHEIRVHGEE
jgi:hypothetical protein